MNVVRIQLLKRTDGAVVLRCDRPDGTATWRRYEGAKAQYLALHDLAHFAVETACGYRRGFFGLVAEGWNIGDFGAPWPRGRVPADAEPVELIVGLLDSEAMEGVRWPAGEFNARASERQRAAGLADPPPLSERILQDLRQEIGRLRARWLAVPMGAGLELEFPRVATTPR